MVVNIWSMKMVNSELLCHNGHNCIGCVRIFLAVD